jgi:hypothetical protein
MKDRRGVLSTASTGLFVEKRCLRVSCSKAPGLPVVRAAAKRKERGELGREEREDLRCRNVASGHFVPVCLFS